jgi:hypothetical protein
LGIQHHHEDSGTGLLGPSKEAENTSTDFRKRLSQGMRETKYSRQIK